MDGDMQVTVEFTPSGDGQEVTAEGIFFLSVAELKAEVAKGNAKYVTVFACRDTYFRYVHATSDEQFKVTFPAGRLRGEVQVFPYIAAVRPVLSYSSDWINPEFGSGPFDYDVGSVLAVDRPQVIYIDRDVFKPLSSVFVLVKEDSLSGFEWQVRPTDDKVQILLSAEAKERIDAVRNNKAHRAVLMNSIYFAAVMQCISLLKTGEYADSRWGRVIMQRCHNEGIDLTSHEEHVVAQRLMKAPFRLVEAYVFKGGEA